MVDTTKILGELLGGGRGSGSLSSDAGAKMLEDLLGVGGGQRGGGAATGGGNNPFGGGQSQGGQSQGGQTRGAPGGGLGDLLGKALKELGQANSRGGVSDGSSGGPFSGGQNPFETPGQSQPVDQNAQSEVYLRAMIQAGLADGRIDKPEQQAIINKVGNIGQAEKNFIQTEMAKGCDVNAFIHTVPRGIEEEVYSVSLMAIQLDNQKEAAYLDALAKGLRITPEQSNAIHDRLGAQRLYS
jgi:uncharacterized membrane protein YebE (DUF533 family)